MIDLNHKPSKSNSPAIRESIVGSTGVVIAMLASLLVGVAFATESPSNPPGTAHVQVEGSDHPNKPEVGLDTTTPSARPGSRVPHLSGSPPADGSSVGLQVQLPIGGAKPSQEAPEESKDKDTE